ncbi:hypothetical protein PHLGIDRAFT_85408 [Phlebiopsis gigantea 11061_1 CR5-6]|uniref:FHA domain-containing protein n=1 Tax=Phlebiopsis gigantea (strain 11061_1 CR5-6) TaxID=745531 RepID=A0A0C3SE45_PHLG1|nr:hypothetical protein PHLGIDRAFT_85408 [Phlebiopsis gigantea 11061_1 CR5-6]
MVRDSRSPRRSHHSENPDSRSRGSRRDYGESSRRETRYSERDNDRRRDDRRRDEPQSNRGRDNRDYERGSSSRRERDRGDRAERGRDGPSRRSASPQRRSGSQSAKSRSKSPEDKAKPNFKPSGLLAAATKTVEHKDGTKTVLKYHEPPEARKPLVGWRLYVFKGQEQTEVLHIHRQSAYLIGRDRLVADIAIEHPSCSKQHAAIQFRQVREKNEFGDVKTAVKPYLIDLESTNSTFVNGEAIPASRYVELKLSDVIKFGESQREYVLLSEDAA